MNPFLLTGYVSPEYFCDRESETEKLSQSIQNNRNVTLFSRRRIGKTALILHTFHKLKSKKDYKFFYIDLYATNNLTEFAQLLGRSILGEFDGLLKKASDTLKKLIENIKPSFSFDPFSGNPVISFDWKSDKQTELNIEIIFKYLSEQKETIVIAFDEFQQILNYPQENIEPLLRTYLQTSPNITCIFSGSQDHLMTSMFKDKSRPFYQSGELFHLEKIEASAYTKFIKTKFNNSSKIISEDSIQYLLDLSETHTYFVQNLCNRLYASEQNEITKEDVSEVLFQILKENEVYYLNYRNLLTKNQWYLLDAIAKENGIKQITSKNFIEKYSLGTPSSVKTALDALLNRGLVFYYNNIYNVEDVFFKKWLQRL